MNPIAVTAIAVVAFILLIPIAYWSAVLILRCRTRITWYRTHATLGRWLIDQSGGFEQTLAFLNNDPVIGHLSPGVLRRTLIADGLMRFVRDEHPSVTEEDMLEFFDAETPDRSALLTVLTGGKS